MVSPVASRTRTREENMSRCESVTIRQEQSPLSPVACSGWLRHFSSGYCRPLNINLSPFFSAHVPKRPNDVPSSDPCPHASDYFLKGNMQRAGRSFPPKSCCQADCEGGHESDHCLHSGQRA